MTAFVVPFCGVDRALKLSVDKLKPTSDFSFKTKYTRYDVVQSDE